MTEQQGSNKKIEVVSYNKEWPLMFEKEAELIRDALGEDIIAIHHIGSTSVPGLAAKPKIDILAEVKNLSFDDHNLLTLEYNYRGGFSIPLRKTYTNRTRPANTNLHIFEQNDPEIELNLMFRDYLRCNKNIRDEYQSLKYKLILEEASHLKDKTMYVGYTLGKHELIHQILKEAGFNRTRLVLCAHDQEWDNYHRIRSEQIFAPLNIVYNPNHPDLKADNHYHFILYKGTIIVSIAHVEFLNHKDAAIRSLATDFLYQNQGYGKEMMKILEKWTKYQGRNNIKLHAAKKAEKFYRSLDYNDISWDDKSIDNQSINLGKKL